jgi:hypothetical protein
MNRSRLLKKPFQSRARFRSGAEDHSLDRLCDFDVVFQTRLQSLQDPVPGSESEGNEWVGLISCDHHGREIAMGSKIQVNILALEISPEIKLSRIHRMGWNGKSSLADDLVAIRKRFTSAFGGNLKADESMVDAADERNKSLAGTQLIELWFAQNGERDGVLIPIERYLAAALVTGVGCYLVPVPECENKEHQETGRQCGADLPEEEHRKEEGNRPNWPPCRLLVGGENAERCSNEEPGKWGSLAERQQGKGGGFVHERNIYYGCYLISNSFLFNVGASTLG